jgi:hypothetical protein
VVVLFGLVGFVSAYSSWPSLGREVRPVFFSVVFLALTPPFYGHAFNNPKDIPLPRLFVTRRRGRGFRAGRNGARPHWARFVGVQG